MRRTKNDRPRLAVFCSGHGTNLQALIHAARRGRLRARIALVVSDQPRAYALTRARRYGIPTVVVPRAESPTRAAFERTIRYTLAAHRIRYIALAGFMRILSPAFVRAYRGRILNIHPALLPAFPGAHAVRDTLRAGAKVTGVTVHVVDAGVDTGPIILQETLPIRRGETESALLQRIHRLEHRLYPQALHYLVTGRLRLRGRRVIMR